MVDTNDTANFLILMWPPRFAELSEVRTKTGQTIALSENAVYVDLAYCFFCLNPNIRPSFFMTTYDSYYT